MQTVDPPVTPARLRPAKRRVAAVLVLDVVGYGRHVSLAPDATLAPMRAGYCRVVKLMGDGAMLEFPKAKAGYDAAVTILRAFAMPREPALIRRPLELRAGLHVGEILSQDGGIFGPTVNIAVRLEAAAPPGGRMMSRAVCDALDGPSAARLTDLARIHLHHVDRPVHVVATEVREP